jgi:2-polyprenyl-3-methyl-5-hydroxy-6-metoxy-1,4-benzoquinol methylase
MAEKLCPLCGFAYQEFFEKILHNEEIVEYVICRRCGFVFQAKTWTQAELDAFYSRQYRTLMQGSESPEKRNRAIEGARAALLVQRLKEGGVLKVRRHLDIGASTGVFLRRTGREFHCEGVGVEPGEEHRRFAAESGLRMYSSLTEAEQGETGCFDLVSLSHVLEHLPSPLQTLTQIRQKFLTPGGWLLVEVPNLYAHPSLEIAHLSAFSRHTLVEMVRKAGFRVYSLVVHGLPRSNVLKLNLTLLAQPELMDGHDYHIKPERLVRLKRRLGMFYRKVVDRWAWLPFPELEEA